MTGLPDVPRLSSDGPSRIVAFPAAHGRPNHRRSRLASLDLDTVGLGLATFVTFLALVALGVRVASMG